MPKKGKKDKKAAEILARLREKFGEPQCALSYGSPFELLVSVILSAQCTDVRVNMVTEKLFREVNRPEDFAAMPLSDLEERIRSTGFYHNKAKNIQACARKLLEVYGGEIPQDMDQLTALPGVGRKTANVVRGEIWGLADGITVDTHVKRLANLTGLVSDLEDPVKIERELMKIIPRDQWINISHFLILQGRDKCVARRPRCAECEIRDCCDYGANTDKTEPAAK